MNKITLLIILILSLGQAVYALDNANGNSKVQTADRWDIKVVKEADQWVGITPGPAMAIGLNDRWWKEEKTILLHRLEKFPDCSFSDDIDLLLATGLIYYDKDYDTAEERINKICSKYPDGTIYMLSPSLDPFDPFDKIWRLYSPIIVSMKHGKIHNIRLFMNNPGETSALHYFNHIQKYPNRTHDLATLLSTKLMIIKNKGNDSKIILQKFMWKNQVSFLEIHNADKGAAEEEYGVYIFNIERVFTADAKFLALELKKNGELDQAISVLESFTKKFCDGGWYSSFNELLGDFYLEKGGEENAKKAAQQYILAEQGWLEEKKNECRKTSLGIPMAPQESSLFSEDGNLKHWEREFNRLKEKVEKSGGKLPVNLDDEIKKLKDFFSSIRGPKPIPEEWNLKPINFVPDDLNNSIAKNDINSLKKWSQDFTYGTKAIEKLGSSPGGLKALECILTEASAEKTKCPRHLSEILSALKKAGKLDVKQLLKTVKNDKIRETLYNFSIEKMPEEKALDLCFQKVKEYASDPDAHVDELYMFLKGFGNRMDSKSLECFSKQLGNRDADLSSREKCLAIIGEWISLDQETQNIINDMIRKIMLDTNGRSKAEVIRVVGIFKNPSTLKYIPLESEENMEVTAEAIAEYFHCKSDLKRQDDKVKAFIKESSPLVKKMSDMIRAPDQQPNRSPENKGKGKEIPRNLTKEESVALKGIMYDKNKSLEELRLLDKIMTGSSDRKLRDRCRKDLSKWLRGYSSCRDFVVSIAAPLIPSGENPIRTSAMEVLGNSIDLYNSFLLEPYLDDKNQEIRNCAMRSCDKLLFLPPSTVGENIKGRIQKIKDIFFAIQTEYSSASLPE